MNKLFSMQSDHPLFRYCTQEERKRIEDIGTLKRVGKDEYVIRAGSEDSNLFSVESGNLEIVAERDNRRHVIAAVGPGEILGEISFIDDSPRTVSVQARETSLVRVWDKRTLSEALAFDPQLLAKFSVAMCELLVERLRDTAKRV